MSNDIHSNSEKAQPMIYQIRIKGHLDRKWADWFSGLSITSLDNGETLLTGPVLDQAMLHGLLIKVRDAGWGLIATVLTLASALLMMFGEKPLSPLMLLMILPIFLQEIVLAGWLIVKGFNSSAIASPSAKTAGTR